MAGSRSEWVGRSVGRRVAQQPRHRHHQHHWQALHHTSALATAPHCAPMTVLVPHVDHGHAVRHQQRRHHVAHLALAQAVDGGGGGGAFLAAVPAEVVGLAVPATTEQGGG